MNRALCMALFVVLGASSMLAQRRSETGIGSVKGVVVNELQEPIVGAAVSVKDHSISDTTDAKGAFVLFVPPSATELLVEYPGKQDETVNIAVQMRIVMYEVFARHQFSVHAGGGLSSLWNYSPNEGSYNSAIGYDVGVGYTWFFTKQKRWAIATGVSYASFSNNYKLSSFEESYQTDDGTGTFWGESNFKHSYSINGYTETQQVTLLTIPLMLHYETGKFYAELGGKVGLPLSSDYTANLSEMQSSGIFEGRILNEPTTMGFGTFSKLDSREIIEEPHTAFFVSAEMGAKWQLPNQLTLYTGAYIDYGLNKIIEPGGKKLIDYTNFNFFDDPDAAYKPTGMLFAQNAKGTPFVNKVAPVSIGVRLSLAFGTKPAKKPKKPETPPETPPELPILPDMEAVPEELPELPGDTVTAETFTDTTRVVRRRRSVVQANKERVARLIAVKRLEQPINFDFGSSDLVDESKTALDRKIRYLKLQMDEKIAILTKYPDLKIHIEGHSDNVGTSEQNMMMGKERAEAVKAYLLNHDIPAEIILETVSKGESQPLVPNTSEDNRRKNRRVEIKVVGE
ncbi:hypothetical protein AGMMS49982_01240 [Bacteroidia bacterium]|nr:hypothetical protein AGMMS49982_01240 [Bacteroidia bacterium]